MNDGHHGLGQAPARVDVHDRPPRAEHHDPLDHSSEEEEGEGDANHRVNNAKGLPAIGQRRRVTVACGKKGKCNPQVRLQLQKQLENSHTSSFDFRDKFGFRFFLCVLFTGSEFDAFKINSTSVLVSQRNQNQEVRYGRLKLHTIESNSYKGAF